MFVDGYVKSLYGFVFDEDLEVVEAGFACA